MTKYITAEELETANLRKSSLGSYERTIASFFAATGTKKTVFLSHSHKDKELVSKVVAFIKSTGSEIYVDWLDEDMPRETTSETANKLKEKIKEHSKFLLLATSNSRESKWVPWELGFADEVKGMANIAIFPVADSATTFEGTEFVGIYPIIRRSSLDSSWIVSCENPSIFSSLENWLNR